MTEENKKKLQDILGDRYDVQELIYRGGMGEVYLGRHRQLQSKVAIKIMTQKLSSDPEQKKRFHREAHLYANLRHPNIIPISDFGSDDSFDYMVFPFIDGENLQEKLENEGRLSSEEALNIMISVAKALAYASEKNVIHRDVKPSNIMIERNGNVLMADFGISKDLKDIELTVPGTVLGSPKYMSPEQIMGKSVDSRSDQYSLGLIFYEMITGQFPFNFDDVNALFYSHVNEQPELPEDIAAWVSYEIPAIIEKLTAKDPSERYDSFNTLIEDLKTIQFDQTEVKRNYHPHSALKQGRKDGVPKRRVWLWSAGVIFLLLAAASGLLFYYNSHQMPTPQPEAKAVREDKIPLASEETVSEVSADSAVVTSSPEPVKTIAGIKEMLFNFGRPDTNGWYQIGLNSSEFRIGDEIIYSITAKKDCYVVLLDFSTSDELVQLFPNKFSPDSLIRAGTVYTIPVRGSFEVTGPAGSETVIGFAGDSYFEILRNDFTESPFLTVTNNDEAELEKIQQNIQDLKNMNLIRKNIDFLISD